MKRAKSISSILAILLYSCIRLSGHTGGNLRCTENGGPGGKNSGNRDARAADGGGQPLLFGENV